MKIEELNHSNCRTYLLSAGAEAVLVDPLRERLESYRRVLEDRGLTLKMVVETHTHADHLMLKPDTLHALGWQLVMHVESPLPHVDRHVDEGDVLEIGDEKAAVIHTPGHTPDGISLHFPGGVLTGDALMIGACGRTDFPGGDPGAQYDAVTTKLFSLPPDTVVWPAHDYHGRISSTIGEEMRSNPRFAGKSRPQYIEVMEHLGLPFPERIQESLQVNQSGFEACDVAFPAIADIAAVAEIDAASLSKRLEESPPPVVLDVREPEEFVGELGHVEGALLVPMDALQKRLPKLVGYAAREVIVVCRAGARSASAAAMLRRAGFKHVWNLRGGMLAWVEEGLPTHR
jgi:glyoxylase-like metal-dependent hydrolase (beta-lactamase superfamily II)/rhodanese-related sulfurtransferase